VPLFASRRSLSGRRNCGRVYAYDTRENSTGITLHPRYVMQLHRSRGNSRPLSYAGPALTFLINSSCNLQIPSPRDGRARRCIDFGYRGKCRDKSDNSHNATDGKRSERSAISRNASLHCRRDGFPLRWRAGFDSVVVNGNADIGNCSRIGIYSSEESDNAVSTELHICLINTPTLSR